MMERFLTEPPFSFVTYMPMVNLHLYFEPIEGLPAPYAGFWLTNITNYASQDSRAHFLRNIQQMKNNAVLMQRHDDGTLEPVFVSEEFAAMMECSVSEAMDLMAGIGFYKVTYPEDRPLVRSMLEHRVAYDGSSALTIQKFTANRNRIWCRVHYAFIDDFGEHYVYCTYTDVTALKEHEERLRSVYSRLGDNFYKMSDRTLALFRVNLTRDAFEEVKGSDLYDTDSLAYSFSESIRRRAQHFPIQSERTQFLSMFDRAKMCDGWAAGRTTFTQMMYTVRSGGRSCFVNYTASITQHPLTGDLVAFITEQECNAEKVGETLMNKILAQQFDMVAYLVDGTYGVTIGEAARIKHGSIFPTSMSGDYQNYLDTQVRPKISGDGWNEEEVARSLSLPVIEEELRKGEPYVVNIAIEMDGETYYKQFDFFSIDPEAKFYILLKSDNTEIQREQIALNEQLKTALDAANQANVAKTAFLSSMSHEIRTPMNAIIGLDNIALKNPDLPADTREHLEKIGGSARHLLGLINDILDMSRIESGRMTLRNEEFSFSGMLEQINTMIHSQCQDRGLTYECRILSPVDDFYIGDDMKLKQVIINILGNAVKFTPAPGTVTFTVERTASFEGQSTLRFVMADTGIGMDSAFLPKIFEAFSQENEGRANKYGSTGLGMAITKNIVEMMNGAIQVKSEKGVGSTFTVTVTLLDSARDTSGAGADIEEERDTLRHLGAEGHDTHDTCRGARENGLHGLRAGGKGRDGAAVGLEQTDVRVNARPADTRLRSIISLVKNADQYKSERQARREALANRIVPYNFLLAGIVALTTRSIIKTSAALMVPYFSRAVRVPCTTPGIAMASTEGGLPEVEVSSSPGQAAPGACVMYSMETYSSESAR